VDGGSIVAGVDITRSGTVIMDGGTLTLKNFYTLSGKIGNAATRARTFVRQHTFTDVFDGVHTTFNWSDTIQGTYNLGGLTPTEIVQLEGNGSVPVTVQHTTKQGTSWQGTLGSVRLRNGSTAFNSTVAITTVSSNTLGSLNHVQLEKAGRR
jgi:hypothetical protein